MKPDQERWAEAFAVLRQHEDRAAAFAAERIEVLTRAGDAAGAARWLEIAARMDRLRAAQRQTH